MPARRPGEIHEIGRDAAPTTKERVLVVIYNRLSDLIRRAEEQFEVLTQIADNVHGSEPPATKSPNEARDAIEPPTIGAISRQLDRLDDVLECAKAQVRRLETL